MTLRRFVSVTIDNFRQLIQTIATPTIDLPVPQLVRPTAELPTAKRNGESTVVRPPAGTPANGTIGSDEALADDLQAGAVPADEPAGGLLEASTLSDGRPQGAQPIAEPAAVAGAVIEQTIVEQPVDLPAASVQAMDLGAEVEQVADSDPDVQASGDETMRKAAPAKVAAETAEESQATGDVDLESKAQEELAEVRPPTLPLLAALESLLFVSDEAVEPAQLAKAVAMTPAEVEAALQELDAVYRRDERGLRLQTRNGRYQLVTAPEAANLIETFLNLDLSARLSAPALETLAVVAYRQPVTRAQIEVVRGVDCSGVLRSLLQRGLLEEIGRLDAPGRPVLYGVTDLFMHHFGLTTLHELPPLDNSELARIEEVGA